MKSTKVQNPRCIGYTVADPDIMKKGGLRLKQFMNCPAQGRIQDADSRPEAVRAKATAARGVWGHAPPRKFLNFRSSEIVSDAFWDDFPACQGTRTNCNRCCKSVTLYIRSRRTIDRTPP